MTENLVTKTLITMFKINLATAERLAENEPGKIAEEFAMTLFRLQFLARAH